VPENVTEPQATDYNTRSTHIYNTGTVSQALVLFPGPREMGDGLISTVYACT